MRSLLVLFVIVLLACTSPPRHDATVVNVSREFSITLHADTAFTARGREILVEAADKWRAASEGRVQITVVFDLDADSMLSLQEHRDDSIIVGALSSFPAIATLDAQLGRPGVTPVAATVLGRTTLVIFIIDRISGPEEFLSDAMHEFGHVFGLPDIPTAGDVMSAGHYVGVTPPTRFTAVDLDLCRASRLCP